MNSTQQVTIVSQHANPTNPLEPDLTQSPLENL